MGFPKLRIEPGEALPIYAQLEQGIRQAMIAGELKVGDQLPTVRQLAVTLSINANTVAKVYAELERSGLLETKRGVGTFIAKVERQSKRDRQQQLETLGTRLLSEAHRAGFTLEEILSFFESKRRP